MKIVTILTAVAMAYAFNEKISDDQMAELFFDTKLTSFLKELYLENLLNALSESGNDKANASFLSVDCMEDSTVLLNGIMKTRTSRTIKKELVIPVLDSTGKIGSGMTRGRTKFGGSYQQCVAIDYLDETKGRRIRGGYFRIAFNVPVGNTTINFFWDVCLPKSCSKCDLRSAVRSVPKIGEYIHDMTDGLSRMPEFVFASYIVGSIMLLLIILCLLAGAVDYYDENVSHRKSKGMAYEFLMVFSIYKNFRDLISINRMKKHDQINSVDCIRALSIVWLVTCHTVAQFLSGDNKLDVLKMLRSYTGQLFVSGYFAVDSFFFISGLLLAFQQFKDIDRNPHALSARSWAMFYLHRIFRLSPPYYAVILFYTFIFSSWVFDLGNLLNPRFPKEYCRSTWWTNILYLNNFIEEEHMCYMVSWYLATDFQIYIFTPILILPLALAGMKVGFVIAFVILAVSTGLNAFQVFYFYLPATGFTPVPVDPRMRNPHDYQFWNYYMPYIRCQVVIVGFLVGYLLQKKKTMQISKLANLSLWSAAFLMMNVAIFGIRDWINGNQWPLYLRAIYSASSRLLWALGLSWIVIACQYGYGGLVNTVMSWSVWTPMARLSYCVYLLHLLVMAYVYSIDYSPIVYSGIIALLLRASLPIIVISFVVAAFWSCVFEIPCVKLEMMILGGRRRQSVNEKPE